MTMKQQRTEADALKGVLSSIFKRKGGNGRYTRLFDDLETTQKDFLLKEVSLSNGELPVIGSVESAGKWLLLTTDKIKWCLEGKVNVVVVTDIRDATADIGALNATNNSKLQLQRLQLITMAGPSYSIELENGAPLSGVWNALRNLGARNRRNPSTSSQSGRR